MIHTAFIVSSLRSRWLVGLLALLPVYASATNVLVETPLGNFEIELFDADAPRTVENFLNYVNDGDYEQSFVHRSIEGFVIQGGGFNFFDELGEVPEDPPIANEFNLSNLRGTIAMAKLGGDPDSATNEWFINLDDNSANLDVQNGGFTVFGQVVGNGMDIVDAIAELPIINVPGIFTTLPVIDFTGGVIEAENLVFTNMQVLPEPVAGEFRINLGMAGSWFNPATNGQGWVFDVVDSATIQLLAAAWFTFDINAPGVGAGDGFGNQQQRWFSATGNFDGNTAQLDIFSPGNGVFDNADFLVDRGESVGTMTVSFSDCSTGEISFDFDSPDVIDNTVEIRRIASSALCQAIVDGDLVVAE